ncbi:MAG: 2-oxoacid:acceptor oxidoreductase family protein [Chloroflexota bacterium]|nr:2-oxoacid:acceptor oxidoreductase family protein [Chloroflexota bacterium]
MLINEITIRIGGAAGDGIESSSAGFCKALSRGGLHIFGLPDYYSRIRGGHNFYSIRVSERPLYSHTEPVHLLLALTEETIPRHQDKLVAEGVVVYDSSQISPQTVDDVRYVGVPLSDIAKEHAGIALARNTVAFGVAAGITGFDLGPLKSVIRDNFAPKVKLWWMAIWRRQRQATKKVKNTPLIFPSN